MRQDWTGCYRDGWKGIITEASFAHPAKFSRGLIRRIYEHAAGAKGGEDFWSAARQIVEETYKVLAPGAHAIWVVKGFVRKRTYVDFPDQWRQLCEAVGFETLHWHNAMLVEQGTQQHRLDGGVDDNSVERKSFFRRLAESKGSPRIDFEVVLCMVKPPI